MAKDCIIALLGETDKDGYKRLWVGGLRVPAHRYVWTLMRGPIPVGKVVMHTCDNPPCVNINHLKLASVGLNRADCVAKKRHAYGERSGHAIITEVTAKKIIKLLASGEMPMRIANKLNISRHIVNDLKRGKTWRHLPR